MIKNSKISVHKSAIQGLGIFANVPIKKGECVGIIRGRIYHKINQTIRDVFAHPDWVGFSKFKWIDPRPPFKHLNHSCNPNVGIKGSVTVTALRDIKAGEEVTVDYSSIEPDPRWHLPCECACGSPNCRKEIRSIEFLPEKLFNKYMPYIPTRLQAFYHRHATKRSGKK